MKNESNQPAEEVVKAPIVAKVKTKPKALKTISDPNKLEVTKIIETPKIETQPVNIESKVGTNKTTISEEIWEAIKERELGLFGLAGQTIQKYCTPMSIDSSRCLLKYKVSSVIPALENVVPDFDFEVIGAYLAISKKKK